GMCGTASDDDAPCLEGCAEILDNQSGAEADAFDDSSIDVGRRVLQRQSRDRATRGGIRIGRSVALEMIEHEQSFTAWVDRRGCLVQRVERCLRREVTLEPGNETRSR